MSPAKPPEYLAVYERLIPGAQSILEIGVYEGGSLEHWRKLSPNAQILGLDHAANQNRSAEEVIEGDQGDIDTLAKLIARGPFDVVIDDGSHRWSDQQVTFSYLWPHTKTYVIEDLQTSFLPDSEWATPGLSTADWLLQVAQLTMEGNRKGSLTFHSPGMAVFSR